MISAVPPNVLVYVCSADEPLTLQVFRDPDGQPESGDEVVLWEIRGSPDRAGLLEIAIGSVPDEFTEVNALPAHIGPSAQVAVLLLWDRFDQGITFVPADLPTTQIDRGAELLPPERFIADAEAACS